MEKEIGSIFPLYPESFSKVGDDTPSYDEKGATLYATCREALFDIAKSLQLTNRIILFPAYTCYSMVTLFEKVGWTCHFFNIHKNLRIDVDDLLNKAMSLQPALLLVHPYYGMDLLPAETEAIRKASSMEVKIIVDLTQCLFSTQRLPFVDFYVGSYRKWFPIPDGAFLFPHQSNTTFPEPKTENEIFVSQMTDAMYLRGQYFLNGDTRTKAISIRLSKSADKVSESDIHPHCMSQFSRQLLHNEDFQYNQQKRIENYTFLFNHIKSCKKYQPVCDNIHQVTTAPLYYTLYVANRDALQKQLFAISAYAPVIWPIEDSKVLINSNIQYIYNHILALPCDQRYNIDDMQRMIDVISMM